ncbi:MAG: DUF6455 family protein [Rhodovulum sp.]|jgi:hypothetical protein|uniref:DUF6455 family protein n=1 Tax=Rhodovulum sp. FJ3 TaxID=3079053 RepID=UPI000C08DE5C|nr:DUF6455 family protein [Rhodovulum sp. FJ3]MAY33388.1 hypothetical protein [Rhodovulum sp.]MCI5084633.1 DUF6455 family protein [Rhodovulum sp.]MDV4168904.1 DUF6455 family protein [Rhodovulum sp. FJ3]|tara:strand:+ start:134 stop:409 length:276 start_codon:yes stop_codon:yes gene_type:complete
MKPLGKPIDHYWKVQDMAKATGTDLVAAWQDGRIGEQEWAGMVERCRACQWVDGCKRWLDQHGDGNAEPPVDCVNHRRFEHLRATGHAPNS